MIEQTFGALGAEFQQTLIKTIIEEKKYGETIIDIIDTKYFDNNSFRFIISNIKEFYNQYKTIPGYENLKQKMLVEIGNEEGTRIHLDTLTGIKDKQGPYEFEKDQALNFCKQQNLKKELKKVDDIINSGSFQEYEKIEGIIQKAMQIGLTAEDPTDIFSNIDDVLEKEVRFPIPTGVEGIDRMLKGGLSRGELGVVLAPTGVGKTTLLTKFASAAYMAEFNVLQIFFEDIPGTIKRKHYTALTGIDPDELSSRKEEVKEILNNIKKDNPATLNTLKLSSDSITMTSIKNRVRKFLADGHKIDLLLIDYVDCIVPEKPINGEEWKGEGVIMRSIESMAAEMDIAIWVATQGNRDSIASEVVTANQTGGSIKKMQVGHIILTVAKTLTQKENQLATMSLVKSRIGDDGVIWTDCKFDNRMLIIDTDSQTTLLGHQQEKEKEKGEKVKQALIRGKELNEKRESVQKSSQIPALPPIMNDSPKSDEPIKATFITAEVKPILPEQKITPEERKEALARVQAQRNRP
jgi:replicative DNA helicase